MTKKGLIPKILTWLPWWLSGKESACQCRRWKFNPWVQKTPWRRKQQPTPVYLPGKFQGQRNWRATVHGVTKQSDTTLMTKHNKHPKCINSSYHSIFFFKKSLIKIGQNVPIDTFLKMKQRWLTYEKMFYITNHQGNANQNHSEISPYTCQNGYHQK